MLLARARRRVPRCGGAPAQPKPLLVGAAEDALEGRRRARRRREDEPRRARRLRHDPADVDLAPGQRTIDEGERRRSRRSPRGRAARDPPDRLRLPVRLEDDAAVRDHARRSSPPTRPPIPRARARRSAYVIVGNEPNLNRFWMPQFTPGGARRGRRRPTSGCSPRPTTRSRRRPGDHVIGGSRLAARRRQPRTRPADPLADALHPRPGRRPTGRAAGRGRSWTGSPSTRTWRRSKHSADVHAPATSTTIALADYDKLVGLLGAGVRRHRRSAARRCRSSTTSSASRRRSRRTSAGSTRTQRSPAAVDAVDESDAGGATTAGAAARRVPAERRRAALLPRHRRGRSRPLAVRRLLRGRHAEVEPAASGRRPRRRAPASSSAAASSRR